LETLGGKRSGEGIDSRQKEASQKKSASMLKGFRGGRVSSSSTKA